MNLSQRLVACDYWRVVLSLGIEFTGRIEFSSCILPVNTLECAVILSYQLPAPGDQAGSYGRASKNTLCWWRGGTAWRGEETQATGELMRNENWGDLGTSASAQEHVLCHPLCRTLRDSISFANWETLSFGSVGGPFYQPHDVLLWQLHTTGSKTKHLIEKS